MSAAKYKSPIIRSRNSTVELENSSPSNVESPSQPPDKFNDVLVFDNEPRPSPVAHNWRGRGHSSPRFDGPRTPRTSPYRWNSPNAFNNSWNSPNAFNNSWNSDHNVNSFSPYRPPANKYKKQNHNNYSNRNNEDNVESYFHPSMLEDPWAPLLSNSTTDTK